MPDAVAILRQYGILIPEQMIQAAQAENLDLAVAATVLIGESGGGRNIFGHDTTDTAGTYTPGGQVTQANYLAYRAAMKAGRIPRNGVGPCQCTSSQYQDTADALGGAWDVVANMRSGFRGLGALIRRFGSVQLGAQHYNGGGPAAVAYGKAFASRYNTWKARLVGATVNPIPTTGGVVTPPAPTYGNLGVRGLDYSAATIPGATIKAAGYQFVIRYVDDPKVGLNSKHIRPAEYQDLIAAGVQVFLVFEVGTGDMLAGHDAGVANARRARAGADWIGYPAGAPIFMACDMHENVAQLLAALAYVDGAVSALGDACGVYGFWELVDACIAQRKGRWFWQAGVNPDPTDAVHVWQRNDQTVTVGGVACDINELRIPLTTEEDMTPEDRAMLTEVRDLLRWVWSQFAGENAEPFKFTGWPSLPAGSGKRLTLVDYGRQADAQLETLKATVAGLVARQAQP